jgi:hypothetical protein
MESMFYCKHSKSPSKHTQSVSDPSLNACNFVERASDRDASVGIIHLPIIISYQ